MGIVWHAGINFTREAYATRKPHATTHRLPWQWQDMKATASHRRLISLRTIPPPPPSLPYQLCFLWLLGGRPCWDFFTSAWVNSCSFERHAMPFLDAVSKRLGTQGGAWKIHSSRWTVITITGRVSHAEGLHHDAITVENACFVADSAWGGVHKHGNGVLLAHDRSLSSMVAASLRE